MLDASGLLVLPGVVDPHTHLQLDSGSARTLDDLQSGSLSAAAGGVTTYIDFAAQQPGQTFPEVVEGRRSEVGSRSYVYYSTHLSLNAGATRSARGDEARPWCQSCRAAPR
jgi:dihydropyrimidinase